MGSKHSIPIPPDSACDVAYTKKEPYLGDGTKAVPNIDGSPTELVVEGSSWSSWSGDGFSIRLPNGDSYADGIHLKGKALSVRDRMALQDADGNAIAVWLEIMSRMTRTFRIYSLSPIHPGQKPSKNQSHDKHPLYAWYEVSQHNIKVWDGEKFVEQYMSKRDGSSWDVVTKKGVPATRFQKSESGVYNIKVAPGIDPCLMLCFVVILVKMTEDMKMLDTGVDFVLDSV